MKIIKRVIDVLIILICFVIQTTIIPSIKLANVGPNLLLVVVVSYSYLRGRKEGMLIGFGTGILYDIIFGSLIGVNAFCFMLIGFLIGFFNRIYINQDYIVPLLLIMASDFFYNILYYVFEFLLRARADILYYIVHIMLPEMLYTLLFAVFMFKFFHSLEKFLSPKIGEGV